MTNRLQMRIDRLEQAMGDPVANRERWREFLSLGDETPTEAELDELARVPLLSHEEALRQLT